jgi:hypothetical protein
LGGWCEARTVLTLEVGIHDIAQPEPDDEGAQREAPVLEHVLPRALGGRPAYSPALRQGRFPVHVDLVGLHTGSFQKFPAEVLHQGDGAVDRLDPVTEEVLAQA